MKSIVIKDTSRLGRDYLKVGQIMRILQKKGILLIAINDGVDKKKAIKDIYGWGSSTIAPILKKREYLSPTVNFKARKYFKDKKNHYVDESK